MAWRFDQFVVVDFEATCEKDARIYPQEIIEFPTFLLNAAGCTLSEFRTSVRPRHHPRLTAYCLDLTGIRQDQVDAGVELQEALAMLDSWLRENGASNFAVVTWGDWDCRTMLESECWFKGLAKPAYFDRWVNLKFHFAAAFGGGPTRRRNLPEAVREAGLEWVGRWHCSLDNAPPRRAHTLGRHHLYHRLASAATPMDNSSSGRLPTSPALLAPRCAAATAAW